MVTMACVFFHHHFSLDQHILIAGCHLPLFVPPTLGHLRAALNNDSPAFGEEGEVL